MGRETSKRLSGVDILLLKGCPHIDVARANVAAALESSGRPLQWREWDLEAPSLPRWALGYASPTVLVDGIDVCENRPLSRERVVACRATGAPTEQEIVRALVNRPTVGENDAG